MKKCIVITLIIFSVSLFCLNVFSLPKEKIQYLTLQDAVEMGLSTSFEYKKAKMMDKLYKSLMSEYLREYFPKIGVGISREEERVIRGLDQRKTKLDFSLEQLIYDGAKISHARDIAKIEQKINNYEAADIKRVTEIGVVSSFFKVVGLDKKVKMQKEFVESMVAQVKLSEEELKLGEITKLDFLELKTRFEEEKFSLKSLEKDYEVESSNLKKLLKLDVETKIELRSSFFDNFLGTNNIKDKHKIDELISIALVKRKELTKMYLEYKKAEKELKLVQKSYIPTISLIGNYGLEGESLPKDKSYSIGVVFNFSFGGSSNKTNYDTGQFNNARGERETIGTRVGILDNLSVWGSQYIEKNIKYFEIVNSEREFRKTLEIEIKSDFEKISNICDSYEINLTKREIIEERVKLSELKLKLGELKRIDVMKIDLELIKSKLELISTIMSYLISVMELEGKLGVPLEYLELYKLGL